MKATVKKYSYNQDNQKVEEPMIAYNISLSSVLSLENTIQNELELLNISRKGITKAAAIQVSKYLGITIEKMSDLLHTSIRTFQRKKTEETLDVHSSEITIEIAEIITEGVAVFGDYNKFKLWLNTPSMALAGNSPLDLMDTNRGLKMVMQELKRLEHGIFS